ncbi:MAG: hypothetical protein QNJ78_07145 [Gammaproteobacteria bacterium]|nr:hypothetical protein [Gammaproteobacteria bacterium]
MKLKIVNRSVLAGILSIAFSTGALADHNGMHGAGWAGMQNDIHNTVVEDDLSGTEFMEFVSRGAGADSINRYADDTNGNSRRDASGSTNGGGNGGGNGSRGGRS